MVRVNKIKIIFIAGTSIRLWRRNLFTLARPHTTLCKEHEICMLSFTEAANFVGTGHLIKDC